GAKIRYRGSCEANEKSRKTTILGRGSSSPLLGTIFLFLFWPCRDRELREFPGIPGIRVPEFGRACPSVLAYQCQAKPEARRAPIIIQEVLTIADEGLCENVDIGPPAQEERKRIGKVRIESALAGTRIEPGRSRK